MEYGLHSLMASRQCAMKPEIPLAKRIGRIASTGMPLKYRVSILATRIRRENNIIRQIDLQSRIYEEPLKIYIHAKLTVSKELIRGDMTFNFFSACNQWIHTTLLLKLL